jgi:hypothetical protein
MWIFSSPSEVIMARFLVIGLLFIGFLYTLDQHIFQFPELDFFYPTERIPK